MKKTNVMLLIGLILASSGIGYSLIPTSGAADHIPLRSDAQPMGKAFFAGLPFDSLQCLVETYGGTILKAYRPLDLLLVAGDSKFFKEITQEGGVEVLPNRQFHGCLSSSVPVIKPTAKWSSLESQIGYSINGTGVNISILDTGINKAHWDLDDLDDKSATTDPKVLAEVSFVTGHPSVWDDHGHGSHVASIVAGTGNRSAGLYKGVAPGANLLNCKVLDSSNSGQEDWIIDGIFWSVAHKAHVINLSLASADSGNGTDPLSRAVDWAVRQGVTVIIASGSSSGFYKVGKPGIANLGITVGATTDADAITTLGGFGPTLDFRLKPDLCAPGQGITACRAGITADLTIGTPLNDYYTTVSGSSQACAHVAGTVALLLQVHPEWTPVEVRAALLQTANPLGDDVFKRGAGRVDVVASTNSSVLVTPALLDLQVFGTNTYQTNLTLHNLEAHPVACYFTANASLTLSASNCTIPALGATQINLSYTPSGWVSYHQEQIVQVVHEGKKTRLLLCHVAPKCTFQSSSTTIPYAGSFNVWGNVTLDQYIQTDLVNLSLAIYAGSVLLATQLVTTSGLTAYNFTALHSTALYRGSYTLQLRVLQNGAVKGIDQVGLTVYGWSSTIKFSSLSGEQFSMVPLRWNLTDLYGPFIGIVNVSIQIGINWIGIGASNASLLDYGLSLPLGTYPLKLEFLGDFSHEDTTTYGTLQILPPAQSDSWWDRNGLWFLISLSIVAGIIVVASSLVRYVRRRQPPPPKRQAVNQYIKRVKEKPKGGSENESESSNTDKRKQLKRRSVK